MERSQPLSEGSQSSIASQTSTASEPASEVSAAVMPKSARSYQRRELWVTIISASFQPITVFRFARNRALEVVDLIGDLDTEIVNMEKRLDGYIPADRLLAFWKGVLDILKVLDRGYLDILRRLANLEWKWWNHAGKDEGARLRVRKESMIKFLAVYDWVLSLLQNAITSSFDGNRPWFLKSWTQNRQVVGVQRRSSCPENSKHITTEVREKVAIEFGILRWTQALEVQLAQSLLVMQRQYDKGRVFEHYVCHIQWRGKEEREDWQEDGFKWPYPDDSIKLKGKNVSGTESLEMHRPMDRVPSWQEDEELRAFVSSAH